MKSLGIVRAIDDLGRVVLPKEIRDKFDIPAKTPLEMFTDGELIILKKYTPGCFNCGDVQQHGLIPYGNKYICIKCIEEIKNLR